MESNEKYCTCEYGPLGTGRMDSNKCPIDDMTQEEQIEWGCLGWDTVARLEGKLKEISTLIDEPIMLGSYPGLLSRLVGVRKVLEGRIEQELGVASNNSAEE